MYKIAIAAFLLLILQIAGCEREAETQNQSQETDSTQQPGATEQPSATDGSGLTGMADRFIQRTVDRVTPLVEQTAQTVRETATVVTDKVDQKVEQVREHAREFGGQTGTGTEQQPQRETAPPKPEGQSSGVISEHMQEILKTAPATVTLTVAEINQRLELTMRYIRERRLELADKTLAQIEQQKEHLSQTTAARVDTIRSMITAAQEARKLRMAIPKEQPQ